MAKFFFHKKSGNLTPLSSFSAPNTIQLDATSDYLIVELKEGSYLKSTLLAMGYLQPDDLYFYPQIRSKLDLNLVRYERYYHFVNSQLIELDQASLSFPTECKYY